MHARHWHTALAAVGALLVAVALSPIQIPPLFDWLGAVGVFPGAIYYLVVGWVYVGAGVAGLLLAANGGRRWPLALPVAGVAVGAAATAAAAVADTTAGIVALPLAVTPVALGFAFGAIDGTRPRLALVTAAVATTLPFVVSLSPFGGGMGGAFKLLAVGGLVAFDVLLAVPPFLAGRALPASAQSFSSPTALSRT
jgi:hypothetical protein